MELLLGVTLGSLVLAFIIMGLWFLKSHQSQQNDYRQTLERSLDALQKQLVLAQHENERTQDSKSTALRSELSKELQNNRQELQSGLFRTTELLEKKFSGIDSRLDHRIKDLTTSVQTNLDANLKEGFMHFEKIQQHLKLAEGQLQNLNNVGQSIFELNNLLKMPHLRGGFGEMTLERLLADMLPTHAYELQYRIVPNSAERVDAVVKYPKQVLPIDSKFPREQILPLFETNNEQELEAARKNLSDVIKQIARSIAEKYIRPEHGTTDMALLFIPSETIYFELLRNPKLSEHLSKQKVFPVSPNTLAVTLHAVSTARQYYEMARGVEKTVSDLKKSKQHFENFEKRFLEVGTSLHKAQSAFNTAETHLTRFESSVVRLTGLEEQTTESSLPPASCDRPQQQEFDS